MSDANLVGTVIEHRYVVEAVLGRGVMGTVYRARHAHLARCEVAIKVLHASLMSDIEMVGRFDREVALAGRLAHANLVGVLDAGVVADGRPYLVMELARGESLADVLDDGRVPVDVVLDLVAQLLRGLAHAHARGLVHRDLKPENVIVETLPGGARRAKIVDFGIAVARGATAADSIDPIDRKLTAAGLVMGTPHYMAPEYAQSGDADPRGDLYALGVIAYEMLAGVLPHAGSGLDAVIATVSRDAPSFRQRAPQLAGTIDREVEAFVLRLLARRPEDRFASAEVALMALAQIGAPDTIEDVVTAPIRIRAA